MDNEELKKKIIDVLRDNREYGLRYYPDDNYTEVVIDYETIADALIAAGLKFDRNISYTATFNLAQMERINDLERRLAATVHRAEVAERALLIMTKKYHLAERKIATTKDGWFSLGDAQIALLANDAINQVKKELAELGGEK